MGSRQAGGQSTADSGTAALPSVAAGLTSDRTALLSRLHATQGYQAVLGLQRTAGNAAVARWIDRTRGVPAPVVQRTPDPSPGATEVRRLIGRDPALRRVVAGALRAAQPGRAAMLPQWITVRFPPPIDDAIALHPSEIDALLCQADPTACRSSASAGPTAPSRPAAGPSTPGTGRTGTLAIAITPYLNPAEWLAALIGATSSEAQLDALAAALQQAGSTAPVSASVRVDVEIPDRGRLVGLPVAEVGRLERRLEDRRQALRLPRPVQAASDRQFARVQASYARASADEAVRLFLHDLDELPHSGTGGFFLRAPSGAGVVTPDRVREIRATVAAGLRSETENVRRHLADILARSQRTAEDLADLQQSLAGMDRPESSGPSSAARWRRAERIGQAVATGRTDSSGLLADRIRAVRAQIDAIAPVLPPAGAAAADSPLGPTRFEEAHDRILAAARLVARMETDVRRVTDATADAAAAAQWMAEVVRNLSIMVISIRFGPAAGAAAQLVISTAEASAEIRMGLRDSFSTDRLLLEAVTGLVTNWAGGRLAQGVTPVISRTIAGAMAEWGVRHGVQQGVLRSAVPFVVNGVTDRLVGVAGAWSAGRLRGASDAEIERAVREQLDWRNIVAEILAQRFGARLRNRPGAAGATASGQAGRPAGRPRTGSPPDTTRSGPRQRSPPAGPDEQAQPTEPDRASRPQRGDDAMADDGPTRPDLTLPTRIAETEVETFTHQQLLEFFVRLVRRPGPPREQLVVFRTREEFEATWRSRYPTGPMPDGWHGYNSGQPGRIYLPPRSRPLAMLHEALHWASARSRSLEELGQFWDEGVTEWLARRLLGARGSRLAYDANVRFVDELVAEIGDGPILHGYLDRDWSSLRAAIARRVGNETQGASVFDLMRRVGRHQGSSPDLQAARNLLRIGQGTDTAPTGIRRPRPGSPDPAPATSAPPEPGSGPHERPTLPPPPGTPYPPRDYTNPTQ